MEPLAISDSECASQLTSNLTFSGNAYFRYIRADTTNGDINNDSFDQSLYTLSRRRYSALNGSRISRISDDR